MRVETTDGEKTIQIKDAVEVLEDGSNLICTLQCSVRKGNQPTIQVDLVKGEDDIGRVVLL